MTAAAALESGRRIAASLMLDACTIVRLGQETTDPDTGEPVIPETLLYTGPAKVQTWDAQESNPEVGGSVRTLQRYTLHIPVAAYEPAVGDVATITSAAVDPHIVGRRYRVTALLHKSLATAYRLGVEITE